MPGCEEQPLSSYLDGELGAPERERVEHHLRDCPRCARELEALRDLSRRLTDYKFEDITPRELADLHAVVADVAANSEDDGPIFRVAASVGLIAASILIVGMAWLRSIPTPSAQPGQTIAAAPQPWEKTAMTLRSGPVLTNDADWMLEKLAMGGQP